MEQRSKQRTRRAPAGHHMSMKDDLFSEEYDDIWPSRSPSSVRRYHSDVRTETGRAQADVLPPGDEYPPYTSRTHAIPSRRGTGQTQPTPVVSASHRRRIDTEDIPIRRRGNKATTEVQPQHRHHWLVSVGVALLIMAVSWFLLSVVSNWWQVLQDDWHYGRPRTAQYDQAVGHNDATTPSHFIALNLNRHVQIIEMPGGDATKAKVYIGPTLVGPNQDLATVTLTFKDVTGDRKLDMIVNVAESHFVFINDNDQFRVPNADEHVQP